MSNRRSRDEGRSGRTGLMDCESGQVSFLAVWSALALAAFIGLLANTQQQTGWRVRAQVTADATAMATATWVARGLNVTAACNSVQAQSLGGIIVMEALYSTYNESPTRVMAETVFNFWDSFCKTGMGSGNPFFVAAAIVAYGSVWPCSFCQLYLNVTPMEKVSEQLHGTLSGDGKALWKLMGAMEIMNSLVRPTFSIMAQAEACRIAELNGADEVVVYRRSDEVSTGLRDELLRVVEDEVSDAFGLDFGCVSLGSLANEVFGESWVPTKEGDFSQICAAAWDSTDAKGLRALHAYPEGPALDGKERILNELGIHESIPLPFGLPSVPIDANLMGGNYWLLNCCGPIPRRFFTGWVPVIRSQICGGGSTEPPQVKTPLPLQSLEDCASSSSGQLAWTLREVTLKGEDVLDERPAEDGGGLKHDWHATRKHEPYFSFDGGDSSKSRQLESDHDSLCNELSGPASDAQGAFKIEGCVTGCRMIPPRSCSLVRAELPDGFGSDADLRYNRMPSSPMSFRSQLLEYKTDVSKLVPPEPPPEPPPGEEPPEEPLEEPKPEYRVETYYQYKYRVWTAQGCTELDSSDYGGPEQIAAGSRGSKPSPYVLTDTGDDLREKLSFVALVGYRPRGAALMTPVFGSSPARIAYSSAETYNGLFEDWNDVDSFTQDWRARMRTTDLGWTQAEKLAFSMQLLRRKLEGNDGLKGLVTDPSGLLANTGAETFLAQTMSNH